MVGHPVLWASIAAVAAPLLGEIPLAICPPSLEGRLA